MLAEQAPEGGDVVEGRGLVLAGLAMEECCLPSIHFCAIQRPLRNWNPMKAVEVRTSSGRQEGPVPARGTVAACLLEGLAPSSPAPGRLWELIKGSSSGRTNDQRRFAGGQQLADRG